MINAQSVEIVKDSKKYNRRMDLNKYSSDYST